jgi:hypothetical protein
MPSKQLSLTYAANAAPVLAAQRQIDAGHTQLSSSTKGVGQSFASAFGVTAPLAAAAAGAAVAKFAIDSISAASDLNEAQNKVNVVFGQSADKVFQFGETSAESFGISERASYDAAAGFGNILTASGLSADAAADMSVKMVALAGDMASFNNIGTDEALEKIRAGLVGEAEPLRTVGVLLSEARVQQYAYSHGIAETGAELTDAQKVQARYGIILQDTAKQQGDFGRTSESLANQQRVLAATFEEVQAEIGAKLLPVSQELLEVVIDLAPALVHVADSVQEMIGPITDASDALASLKAALPGHSDQEEQVNGWRQASQAIGDFGSGVLRLIPGGRNLATVVDLFGEKTVKAAEATGTINSELGKQETVLGTAAHAARVAAGEQRDLAESHQEAADAAREQRSAELSLAGGILGLASDLDDLQEAQEVVNRLKRSGRTDSEKYRDAVLDAANAAVRFESSLVDLYQEQRDTNQTTEDGVRTLVQIGKQYGLTREDLTSILGPLRDYVRGLNDVPGNVRTNVGADFSSARSALRDFLNDVNTSQAQIDAYLNFHLPNRQHGGPVSAGTAYIVGEAGPEMFVPDRSGRIVPRGGGGGGGGAGTTIFVNVEGSVVTEYELMQSLRRQLLDVARVNADAFGGRA